MVEKSSNPNKIKSIIASILLIVLLFSATYAYFSMQINNNSNLTYNLTINGNLNITYMLTGGSNLSLNVDPNDFNSLGTNGSFDYTQTTTDTDYVMLANNSGHGNVTCTYEIWYEPSSTFTNSQANTDNLDELVIVGEDLSKNNAGFTFNLNGIESATKMKDGYIFTNTPITEMTENWQFSIRHYNLDVDQSSNIGSSFGGRVYFKSTGCKESTITSSSYLVDIGVGETSSVTLTGTDAGNITCTSSDDLVASSSLLDNSLSITRNALGSATIFCSGETQGYTAIRLKNADVYANVVSSSGIMPTSNSNYSLTTDCDDGSAIWDYKVGGLVIDPTSTTLCKLKFQKQATGQKLSDYIMNLSVGVCSNANYTTGSSCVRNGGTWNTTPRCSNSEYSDENNCLTNSETWISSGSCSISEYTNESDCKLGGACYNLATNTINTDYTTENTCKEAGYSWKIGEWSGVFNENGFRYEGNDPDNYVWFNNEMWRIIGVFDTYYDDNSTHDYLIKLIKAESIGGLVWHYENSAGLTWNNSSLKDLLNNYYYKGSDYPVSYTSSTNACSSNYGNTPLDCNYSKKGIININTRNAIANALWNNNLSATMDTADNMYINYDSVYDATNSGYGYIGLMYASDYGYGALSNSCVRSTVISNYGSPSRRSCAGENWLYKSGYEWILLQNYDSIIYHVVPAGGLIDESGGHKAIDGLMVRPSVYLKPSTYYISGDGNFTNPYIIG